MNKRVVISLIVAVALLFSGILICIVGLAITAFNPSNLETDVRSEQKVYTADVAGLTDLAATSSNHTIQVTPATGDQIRITYSENTREHYTFTNENGKLTMTYVQEKGIFWFGFFPSFSDGGVVIELPASYSGSLNLKTSNASINLADMAFAGPVQMVTSNAKIGVDNLQMSGELYTKTSNGAINLENVQAGSVRADTSNAALVLNKVETGGLTAKTSNGRIELTSLKANQIELKTSNARVSGTIIGNSKDYRISSNTSNADNSLTNLGGSGPNMLAVNTSNGDIDIRFTEGADF
jgi:DUF4097 and DUF4098 domain-containing protein YvlB